MSITSTVTPLAPAATARHDVVGGAHVPAHSRLHHRTRSRTLAAADAAVGRYLVVGEGPEALLFPLDDDVTHIGRGLHAEFAIDDHTVSRQHAMVALRPGGCRIFDDRSLNGTFVNGRRVLESDLEDGDVIVVGRVVLRYFELPPVAAGARPDRHVGLAA
jgi:pSer/pThr/pTyr-binding forkhead associated (FHA) protein